MNIAKTLLIAAPLLMLPQLASAAGVCHVDPTGTFGMPFADIDAALAFGGCDAPGSVIEVYCPASGCVHPSVTISGLHDIHIVSAELWGHGAVHVINSYSSNAVSIDTSHWLLRVEIALTRGSSSLRALTIVPGTSGRAVQRM